MAYSAAKRRAAAKKGAATKRRNAAARSSAAKKAAATRKRRANPHVHKRAPARKPPRKPPRKPSTALAHKAHAAKAPALKRRRDPGAAGRFDFAKIVKQTGILAAILGVVLFVGNKAANYKVKNAKGVEVPFAGRIGPLFPLGFDLLALWVLTKYSSKIGLSKYKGQAQTVVGVMAGLDALRLAAYAGARDWSLDDAKFKVPAADSWINYVQVQPVPAKLAGYGGPPQRRLAAGRPAHSQPGLPPGTLALVYNTKDNTYQAVA